MPTWCPFRLQFYCNGHHWLARKLAAEGIAYTMADNAFVRIKDMTRAQALAEGFAVAPVAGQSYRYYLTRLERAAIAAACSLTQFQIIPAMANIR